MNVIYDAINIFLITSFLYQYNDFPPTENPKQWKMLYWKWNLPVFGRMLCLIHKKKQVDMPDNKALYWDVVTAYSLKTWKSLKYIRVFEL